MASSNDYALSRGAACLPCRKKKQRCDGKEPTCGQCVKSGKDCMYRKAPMSKELSDKTPIFWSGTHIREPNITTPRPPKSHGPSISDGNSRERPSNQFQPPPGTSSLEGRSFCETTSLGERIPGANMVWNYNPNAVANLQMQPSDLTLPLRNELIGTFLQNREMCYFDLHVGRFVTSLSLPSGDPQAPHPMLVNAILLVGCYFSRNPSLAGYETGLLAVANEILSTSIHHMHRLHDCVRTSNLIAFYYFCKGLYTEAYQQIDTSFQVAMTCGLHRIPGYGLGDVDTGEDDNKFLSYPGDAIELGERIHTFWQAFCLDKMISIAAGQPARLLGGPTANPLLQISTPWPRLLSDYETGTVSDLDKMSVTNLYMNEMSTMPGRLETLASLRSQGYALLYKAIHLSGNHPTPQEILVTDGAIQTFTSRLPHLMNSGDCGETPATFGFSPINYRIVTIHTLAHVASLALHQRGAADVSARLRCSNAAQGIAAVIGQLNNADYSELFIGLGHLWYTAGRILLTIAVNANDSFAEQNRAWALVVVSALKRISMVYPPLGFQHHELEQML